jgi:4'-phosphopantetheinyl transferase
LSSKIDAEQREIYEGVLSNEERARAGRFVFEEDRARCITARGGLRWLLSSYCGMKSDELRFQAGDHGKPSLHNVTVPLHFNASHSGDCVLIGVTADAECGVDIELPRSNRSELDIAERFFGPREVEWLKRTDKGFYRLWTTKEAIIKAVGRGLSIPLSDVDVTDVVEGRTSFIRLNTPGLELQTVWLQEMNLIDGYAAAVATIGGSRTIRLMPSGNQTTLC